MARIAKQVEEVENDFPVFHEDEIQDDFGVKKSFDEWECKVLGGKVEKLKVKRSGVKITEEQAEILNEGIINGSNTYGSLYFLTVKK